MSSIADIERDIKAYEGITCASSGYPMQGKGDSPPTNAGWVKFGIEKSELGWRTLEFLSWVCSDMIRAGERLVFPTAPAPYLNTPGACLSFVIECHPRAGDQRVRFRKVAEFLSRCREAHWAECRGRSKSRRPVSGNPRRPGRHGRADGL